jgi:hypothetical protein
VRKLPDQVSGDRAAKLPAVFSGKGDGVGIKLVCGNLWILFEVPFPIGKCLRHIIAHLEFGGIRSDDKRATEIRFVLLKLGVWIKKENIVLGNV